MEGNRMEFRIVDGSDKMSIEDIARLLKMTYWADKRSMETIEKSVSNSSCYGIYADDQEKLIGFARVISDFATSYYLCDVIIDPEYRNRGLGTALVSHIVTSPEYVKLRGFLITRDAHDLYKKFGFEVVDGRVMVKAPEQ
jgi:ribosomal protein S18 acetylase RimI-like enzyme